MSRRDFAGLTASEPGTLRDAFAILSETLARCIAPMIEISDEIARSMGPRADARKRPRRIRRKLRKRGGYRKHRSLGAMVAKGASS